MKQQVSIKKSYPVEHHSKIMIRPLSKVIDFSNPERVRINNKYQVHVNTINNYPNPFNQKFSTFSSQVQDLRDEKVDLDEVEDITSESKLESMLETAKDYRK